MYVILVIHAHIYCTCVKVSGKSILYVCKVSGLSSLVGSVWYIDLPGRELFQLPGGPSCAAIGEWINLKDKEKNRSILILGGNL